MPAILRPEVHDAWLNPNTKCVELLRMLSPFPSSEMKIHPISNNVSSPDKDTADLLATVVVEMGQRLSLF
jgi:putative SOS response-associated peptidase YedK